MTCTFHPDLNAVAYCRNCGRALCPACQRVVNGIVYCPEHVPAGAAYGAYATGSAPNNESRPFEGPNPYAGQTAPLPVQTSPGLAFFLGLIPGVGAIYNGQYLKGFVHVAVLGVLITLISNDSSGNSAPFLGLLIAAWFLYMPFEAFHTAKRRQSGMATDEWSGLLPRGSRTDKLPIGPVVLIGLGVIFLLDSLHIITFREISRYFWPIFLIAIGAYSLYTRMSPQPQQIGPQRPMNPPPPPEQPVESPSAPAGVRHE